MFSKEKGSNERRLRGKDVLAFADICRGRFNDRPTAEQFAIVFRIGASEALTDLLHRLLIPVLPVERGANAIAASQGDAAMRTTRPRDSEGEIARVSKPFDGAIGQVGKGERIDVNFARQCVVSNDQISFRGSVFHGWKVYQRQRAGIVL